MTKVRLGDALREGVRYALAHPLPCLTIAVGMGVLASGQLIEFLPLFAPLVASPFYPFLHDSLEVLALGLALFAAYRWHPVLGMAGILLFLALHAPYFVLEYPPDWLEFFRTGLITVIALLGTGLIAELHRTTEMVRQRERELRGHTELTLKVLNERVQFLEEATRKGERLARVSRMISLAAQAQTPLAMAREFLRLLQEEVDSPYASLTLVNLDGTLGERVDSFWEMVPFPIDSRPGGLAEQILATGETQYVADTGTDPRANPDLVQAGIRSYLGIPLKVEGRTAGILFLHSTHPNAFQGEQEFLMSIAAVLGLILHRAELLTQVERMNRGGR